MEFLAANIERITGVKRNRLQQWLERGFITPSIKVASGHGTRNIWSRNDLYTIALFKKITESGLSRKVVSDFLSAGRIESGDNVKSIYCLVYMREGKTVKATSVSLPEDFICDGAPIVKANIIDDNINVDFGTFGIINLLQIQTALGMRPFDDVYIVNFYKLKGEIDAKIEEG